MKSILVIGMGRFGLLFAEKMQQLGNDVMVVDENEELINEISHKFTDSQIGDCCNPSVLKSLGINNFDICFVTIGEDFQASLEVTSLLNEMGAKHIVSKARSDRQAKLLLKIGANEIIYPERELSEKLAVRYNADNIFDYIQLTPEYSIFEIPCSEKWIGHSVSDVDVRSKYKINIIAINHEDKINIAPGADYVFARGDHLVVLGKASDINRIGGKPSHNG